MLMLGQPSISLYARTTKHHSDGPSDGTQVKKVALRTGS